MKVSGSHCTAHCTHNMCVTKRRDKRLPWWRDKSRHCTVIKQREKSHVGVDGQKEKSLFFVAQKLLRNRWRFFFSFFLLPQLSFFSLADFFCCQVWGNESEMDRNQWERRWGISQSVLDHILYVRETCMYELTGAKQWCEMTVLLKKCCHVLKKIKWMCGISLHLSANLW